jgi:hypothetical protein
MSRPSRDWADVLLAAGLHGGRAIQHHRPVRERNMLRRIPLAAALAAPAIVPHTVLGKAPRRAAPGSEGGTE